MDKLLADLIGLLALERLELDLFRGESRDIGNPQVFGGQVLGQALMAASLTVEARACHSLHGYFLRRGDVHAPIVYQVDRSRDGHSFSSRRVVAIQHGEQIFHMACSFKPLEAGLEHAQAMPEVPPPEALEDMRVHLSATSPVLPEKLRVYLQSGRPFEFRPVQVRDYASRTPMAPIRQIWFRAVDRLSDDDPVLHRCLLAYISDYHLLETAILPHVGSFARLQVASIDHAMWFHRSFRADEWMLYSMDSPSASDARGFARGSIFDRDGALIASTAQEGLMRARDPDDG